MTSQVENSTCGILVHEALFQAQNYFKNYLKLLLGYES
jgi:hypothetical protein